MEQTSLRASHEGLKVNVIKEYGFNPKNFKTGPFYEVEECIEDLNNSSYLPKETTIKEPSEYETEASIQIGSAENNDRGISEVKGFFCEKPPLTIKKDTEAYFFPLGSSGSSFDSSYAAQGFEFADFLEGGDVDKNSPSLGKSVVIPYQGDKYSGNDFSSKSGYDKNCFFDYRGIHTSSNNKNLLKYPSVSTETETLSILAGASIDYTLKNVDKVLNVVITNEASETLKINEDYIVYSTGLIKGLKKSENATTLTLTITRHSFWEGCWNFITKGKISNLKNTFLRTKEGLSITSSSSDEDYYFKREITIEEEGDYFISLYASCDQTGGSWLSGLHFAKTDRRYNRLGSDYKSTVDYTIETKSKAYISGIDATSYENTCYALTNNWKRYASKTHLTAGTYTVYFAWNKEDRSAEEATLRVMGLCVEKDRLSDYDYRAVNYSLVDFKGLNKHILSFNLPKGIPEVENASKDWVISYIRQPIGYPLSNPIVDQIGNNCFEYSNNKIFFNGNEVEVTVNVEDLYNRWEQVILKYDSTNKNINVEVTSSGNTSNPSIYYTFTADVSSSKFSSSIYSEENTFNLLLGAEVENNKAILTDGIYRNLWWFPNGLSEKELNLLKSNFLSYYIEKRKSSTGVEEENLILKGDFLYELPDDELN